MDNGTTPNAHRLLWAGFFAIFASGVGFSVRGGILGDWASSYGFTMTELGGISGGGLWGFGIIIILFSLIADRIGYGRLMAIAFATHVASAILQLLTGVIYEHFGKDMTYWSLVVAMVLFSIGNGICETVVNPMTATLFPRQKTHYLNILHAGWPAGLVAGSLVAYFMNKGTIGGWAPFGKVHWMVQMSLFLIPVAVYGLMLLGQRMPRSEAGEAGIDFWTMLSQFAAPLLLFLLLIHAMVGYVELGTDSWISKITGTIMGGSKANGLLLLAYTSGLMFALRFFAGPIVHRISPLGLLLVSAILACIGLSLLGRVGVGAVALCVVAATIYGCGKTFFWPTMLAVASERFPKGGALVIGAMGGMGMLSAGLLGNPAIGFQQDVYASDYLKDKAPATYERYAAPNENSFYGIVNVRGLDGSKVGVLDLDVQQRQETQGGKADDARETHDELERQLKESKLTDWWTGAEPYAEKDKPPIDTANLVGGQAALRWTAVVPATMAVCYLLLLLYFLSQGGYKQVHIGEEKMAELPGGDMG